MTNDISTDRALIIRWRGARDQDAAAELYRRHARGVHALLARLAATRPARARQLDDVAQETWSRWFAWIDPGQLLGDSAWPTLTRFAHTASRAALRRALCLRRDERLTEPLSAAATRSAEATQGLTDLRLTLFQVLERLPPEVRRVVEAIAAGKTLREAGGTRCHYHLTLLRRALAKELR